MGTITYIKNFLKDPNVASVTPTSRFTVDRVCRKIDFNQDIRIIEFGPGDGVFTKKFLQKCTSGSSLIVIETNNDFAESLRKIEDDRLIVENQSAVKVGDIVKTQGWDTVDYIVSGIPFSFLTVEEKNNILEQSAALISREGSFLGYQTSSHLKPDLKKFFKDVETEMEYRNIPPMCIYMAKEKI